MRLDTAPEKLHNLVISIAGVIIIALMGLTWSLGYAWADKVDQQVKINTDRITRLEMQYEQNDKDHARIIQTLEKIEAKVR